MANRKAGRKKTLITAVTAVVLVLVLAAAVELLVFNRHAWQNECYTTYTESEEREVTLELGKDQYIKTVSLEMTCEENTGFEIRIYQADGALVYEETKSLNANLDIRIINVRKTGSRIVIDLQDIPESKWVLRADNFFEWNGIRFLFFFVLFGSIACFFMIHKSFWKKPELIFAGIGFAMGILLILITGTNQISYDEQTHITKVWNLSYIGTVYDTEASLECKTLAVPSFHNIWEKREVEAYLDAINDYETANVFYQTKMISYEKRAYLPMAVCMAVGRSLQLPFAGCISLSKFGNLLMYIIICALAVRIAKKGKGLVAVIALMPNSIFSASQFSYDACVNCFLILAMVLVMNEILEPERKVKSANMLAILLCFIIGSYSKQVYILMALMLLFFSCKKFPGKRSEILFKIVLTVLCFTMLYEVLAPSYSGTSAAVTLANAGDIRTEGTSTMGQIRYIISHPFDYAKLLLSSIFVRPLDWLTGKDQFIMYAYLGTPGTLCTWIWLLTFLFAAAVGTAKEERSGIGAKFVVLNLLMVFCMSAVVWTVLYLSFNAVGNGTIIGVQDRYFTPLFLPFGICFFNAKLRWRWSEELYYKILFGICAAVLLYCNWKLGIVAYYL